MQRAENTATEAGELAGTVLVSFQFKVELCYFLSPIIMFSVFHFPENLFVKDDF